MTRSTALLGAPSSIGIRPYDDGTQRRLDRAPATLRGLHLAARLHASDAGDVVPPPYRDFTRTPGIARNESLVMRYTHDLARRLGDIATDGSFVLLLGGDCSIVLGALLGIGAASRRVGLAYIDAHADFATPATSRSGSVASMCLALATGRGETPLARVAHAKALVRPPDVVVIGRHDDTEEPWYDDTELAASGVLDLTRAKVEQSGAATSAEQALARLTAPGVDGFWIHVDADVVDPAFVPAVDSPESGGLTPDELVQLLQPLARHPNALGLELTIYDPALDADGRSAAHLADILVRSLTGEREARLASPYWETLARSHQ